MDILQIKKHFLKREKSQETWEFFINDKPLSSVLESSFGLNPFVAGQVMVFGNVNKYNKITAQLFTLKTISMPDLSCDERGMLGIDEEIKLLYGCPCGDYQCGGIGVKITATDDTFVWEIDKDLTFTFDKWQYYEAFNLFLR